MQGFVGLKVGIAAGPHRPLLVLEMAHGVLHQSFDDGLNPGRVMAHLRRHVQVVDHAQQPFVLFVDRCVADAIEWFPLDVMFHDLLPMIDRFVDCPREV